MPFRRASAANNKRINKRAWYVTLYGEKAKCEEILKQPHILLEGRYREVFTLLYGFDPRITEGLAKTLQIDQTKMDKALADLKVLRSIDKINLSAMPIQDAIDLAVFLATVQVELDRFLPGPKACGGPIDVMVLQMAPEPKIRAFPGKTVQHPLHKQRN